MELSVDTLMLMGINLVTLGAFYGAIKVEIYWIKKSIDRIDSTLERVVK